MRQRLGGGGRGLVTVMGRKIQAWKGRKDLGGGNTVWERR